MGALPVGETIEGAEAVDKGRRRMHAASVTDGSWADEAVAPGGAGPYFLAAEAVLPFLPEAEARRVVDLAGARFPGAVPALDAAGPGIVGTQESHDALSKVEARMRWASAGRGVPPEPPAPPGPEPLRRLPEPGFAQGFPIPLRACLP